MNAETGGRIFAAEAFVEGRWRNNITLQWDAKGKLITVASSECTEPGIAIAAGPLIPGMPNLHSHAFQRGMAGLAESMVDPKDSFWSWRTLMYRFAEALSPDDLTAICTWLYIEMLKAGYTSVCEFHYLHHAPNGQRYADAAELSERVIQASQYTGIGLTLLPVLYEFGGFNAAAPSPQQSRFVSSAEWISNTLAILRARHPVSGNLQYGAAPHSLRATTLQSIDALRRALHAADAAAPMHIHIAEQRKEVEQCIETLGARPVDWLLDNQPVDARWCLVHATHMSGAEYDKVAASGAVVGLCPSTEANLGDGFFDATRYLEKGASWGVGSDSHIAVDPFSELRLLEYGQRLVHQRRNVLASVEHPIVADRLYDEACAGGALASGRAIGNLAVGYRADFVVLDPDNPAFVGRTPDQYLSGAVFAEHGVRIVRDVFVGGYKVIDAGKHIAEASAFSAYRAAVTRILTM